MHKTLPYYEWLKNIRIKTDEICSYCNNIDAISHFVIDCNSNKLFWKSWAIWWLSITSFNIRMEENVHESILFGFPESGYDAIVINYCIIYAKQYIYLEKLYDKNIKLNVDFLNYLSHLKNKYLLRKPKNSSSTNLTSYMKICKPVFHNVLYCIIMFMHCIYT